MWIKRLAAALTVCCLLVSAGGAALGEETDTPIPEGERPAFVQRLLDVARGELGYAEGAQNYTKYGEWSGDPYAEWCAEFICWCVDQTQQSQGEDLLNVIYPNYSGQNTGRNWFIKRGRFVYRKGVCPDWGAQWLRDADHNLSKNEFIPRSGDLVFFSYNAAGDTDHVALIEYCSRDAEGNVYLHVIEGNNPDRVQRKVYPLDNSQVLGFGLCEDLVDTTMRSGNEGDKVLTLQQDLYQLGFLDDLHLTGAYGSHTRAAVMALQQEAGRVNTGSAFLLCRKDRVTLKCESYDSYRAKSEQKVPSGIGYFFLFLNAADEPEKKQEIRGIGQ